MKTLLTGVSGTGKSTIVKELNKRGITAIDLHDVPGLLFWRDRKTGEKVSYTPGRPREWFDTVERLCDIDKLQEMFAAFGDVIMAGTAGGNQGEYVRLFDKVILLQCDPHTLVHRLETRTNKTGFGKSKSEQDDNIEWQKVFDPELLAHGAIPVSTDGPVDGVVDKIITLVKAP